MPGVAHRGAALRAGAARAPDAATTPRSANPRPRVRLGALAPSPDARRSFLSCHGSSIISAAVRRSANGLSPPRFAHRHRQFLRTSLFLSSHPTPSTGDRPEPCSATLLSPWNAGRPHRWWSSVRYRLRLRSESRGARPVLRTGRRALFRRARLRPARLHEARYAVFALRVTIPGAFAPFGRCALRLRVRTARPRIPAAVARSLRSHRRRLSPTTGTRASRRVASLRPRLRPPRRLSAARLPRGLATGSALTRHRGCSRPSRNRPRGISAKAHRSSSDIALSRPALRAMALRTDRLPVPSPPPARRPSPSCAPAARPCRGTP